MNQLGTLKGFGQMGIGKLILNICLPRDWMFKSHEGQIFHMPWGTRGFAWLLISVPQN